jgi:RNA polymerase sigma factor (sigma-70 family)
MMIGVSRHRFAAGDNPRSPRTAAELQTSTPLNAVDASWRTMNDPEFSGFLKKLRSDDPEAVRQFVDKYRPFVREAAERLLSGADIQRMCDASDICQEVLPDLLKYLQDGQGEFASLDKFEAFLKTMAHNEVFQALRRHEVRGGGKTRPLKQGELSGSGAISESGLVDSSSTPSHRVGNREFIAGFRSRLPPDLVEVLDLYLQGLNWDEIGAALGRTGHALRVRFNLARDKYHREVKRELHSDT